MAHISRRSFVLALSVLAAKPAKAERQKKVAVVGAGVAGLAAARMLYNAGHDVTVIEARDRIGGRIHTISPLGFPMELGANWIHGDVGNPLTKLAADAGVKASIFDFDDWRVMRENGDPLSVADGNDLEKLGKIVEQALDDAADEDHLGETVAEVLDKYGPFADLSASNPNLVRAFLRREISGDYGADADELAAAVSLMSAEYKGNDRLVTNGFDRIVKLLAKDMAIRIGEPVTAIRHSPAGAEIETANGNINVDTVIVTVPLGLLKAGSISFDPPLSEKRQDAMSRTGFGAFEKAFLVLDKPFDLGALNVSVTGKNPWGNLINISKGAGAPAVLAYCGGDDARAANAVSDDRNRDMLLANVRTASKDPTLQAVSFKMSRWLSDPWSSGSYSYPTPKSRMDDIRDLCDRESRQLYFAGEACTRYWGTVHGALKSGIAAAKFVTDV